MTIRRLRSKYEKGITVFGQFFAWPFLYRAALIVLNLALLAVIRFQAVNIERQNITALENTAKINALVISNAYYQSERSSTSKLINEMPTPFWKQEYFPINNQILMMDYNEAMWVEFLQPLGFPRWYYTLKEDEDVFPPEQASIFRTEKMELIMMWMAQEMDENGNRPSLFQTYNNSWKDLEGKTKKEGYYRYVDGVDGHVYIYGGTNQPKQREDLKIMELIFIKPKKTEVKKQQ